MKTEGEPTGLDFYDLNEKNEPIDPEEGFGGDDDGCCRCPECAIQHAMDCNIESLVELMLALQYAGWTLSPAMEERLTELAEILNEVFADQKIVIGELRPITLPKK